MSHIRCWDSVERPPVKNGLRPRASRSLQSEAQRITLNRMKNLRWTIRQLPSVDERQIADLADLLIDCVEGGASVSFMLPLTRDRAVGFWRRVAADVTVGHRALLVAEDDVGICGTVQLGFELPENQPHRADLAKMLVHRRARRQGLGAALMQAAETVAEEKGKTLLVLDAVTDGDGARLYQRLGWVRVGDIPDYALLPTGGPCSTTVFYRKIPEVKRGSGG